MSFFNSCENRSLRGLAVASICVVLAACNAESDDMVTLAPDDLSANTTRNIGAVNTGDNTARASGTGRVSNNGFSPLLFPGSRTGQSTPNTTIGNATAATASVLSGVAAPDTVTVLTFDTNTSSIGQVSGNYDPATLAVTVAGTAYQVASGGNRYTGQIISGGRNLTAIHTTPLAGVPTTGTATFNGTSEILYVNTPTSQTFTGTMNTVITANFDTARVGIVMHTPNGQVDGNSYTGGGNATISDLAITNQTYQNDGQTRGSVTGFLGAANLNSGTQTVRARGVFGGPTAQETGLVSVISDGANGTAIMRTTATR